MAPRAGLDEQVIVQAAVALLDSDNSVSLSLSTVAERLGVKTPSLYKHITGLDGLRRGVALWGLQELTRHMSRAAVGKSRDEAIRAIASAYRVFAKEHPGVYPLTLRAPHPDDAEWEAASQDIVAVAIDVFAAYGLDHPTIIHTIRGFRAVVHGFVSLELAGGFGMPLDVDASFSHLLTTFIQGIPRPPRTED